VPDFTVTIAGSERHDGEEPYTWVLEADDFESAVEKALAHHKESQEDDDLETVWSQCFAGAPENPCGYYWNDLRRETS
jgi:hypothetical protein